MLTSLATRVGARPRRALIITFMFVVIAGAVGGPVAGSLKSSGGFIPSSSDAQIAQNVLQRATGREASPGIVLLIDTPRGPRAASGTIAAAARTLSRVPGIGSTTAPAGVARDGRRALVTGTIATSAQDKDVATATEHAFADDRQVTVGGAAVANEQINANVTKDLGLAEAIAAPLLIILSILFFRGRAAVMPLVVGVTTVLGTFLVLTGINQLYGLSIFALNLVIGMGLGLSVDYTLFLVTRYREELAAGVTPEVALRATMRNAGATVCFSAATVACALATLVVFPQGFLKSMGIAGAAVALVAALVAVSVSPALLALWNVKLVQKRRSVEATRWSAFAHWVMRRPGLIAVMTAAAMIAAGLPALSTVWSPANDTRVIPRGESSRAVADALTREFAGAGASPVTIAISAPRADAAAVTAFARRVRAVPGVRAVTPPRALDADTWQINARVAGDAAGPGAQQAVHEIRDLPAPFTVHVGGDAASFVDQQAAIGAHLPLAIALLAVLTFTVLWLMTDSLVLPLKALVMNTLTVAASLTPLVLIYQHGNLTGLLHYTSDGGVEPTDFLVAATVTFALSTDYGVFLLGRIKESREDPDHPRQDREAVAHGLGVTGRVVTAAAILLAVAIGAFSTSSITFIQEIGVAVATGVLLDAFIVRSLLVPSLMALLGDWNWWSPQPMRRLRRRVVPVRAEVEAVA